MLSTGSGLKDVASVMKAVAAAGTEPVRIAPNMEALRAAIESREDTG